MVHKVVGAIDVEKFLTETRNAVDPQKQFYTLITKIKQLDTTQLKKLAINSYHSGDLEMAGNLAVEYLGRLPVSQLGSKDIIGFLIQLSKCPQVDKFAEKYLHTVEGKDFIKPEISFLISYFRRSPLIQDIVLKFLDSLNARQLKNYVGVLSSFANVRRAKPIADRYIKSLSEEELFTDDNLYFWQILQRASMNQVSRYSMIKQPEIGLFQ